MIKVKIPIFWHTDDTARNEKLGLDDDQDFSEFEQRVLIFYRISAITSYDTNFTKVFSDGEEFISPLNLKQVEKLIDDANT